MATEFDRYKEMLTLEDLGDLMCTEKNCENETCVARHNCTHKKEIDEGGVPWDMDECWENYEAWANREVFL